MTHKEALDLILSHACPMFDDGDVYAFRLNLHCVEVLVRARLLSTSDAIKYEILTVTFL
jgi:hypothetical protein